MFLENNEAPQNINSAVNGRESWLDITLNFLQFRSRVKIFADFLNGGLR